MPATTTQATDDQAPPAPTAAALGPLPQRPSVLAPLGRLAPPTSLRRPLPIPPLPPPAPPAASPAPDSSTSPQLQPTNPTASTPPARAPAPPPPTTSTPPPGARTPAALPDAPTNSAAPSPTPPPPAATHPAPHPPPAPTPATPSQPALLDAPKPAPSLEPPAPLDRASQPALPGAIPGTPKDKPPPPSPPAATTTAASTPAPPGAHEVAVRVGSSPTAESIAGGGGATQRGRPQPPPHPPPPHAVEAATEPGQEHRPVEEYIPFAFVELRDSLLSDHPEVFGDPKVALKFKELCKWISARNTLRLQMDYGDAYEKYSSVDPDKDTLAFKVAGGAEEQGKGGSGCCGGGCCGGGCCGGGASKKQEAVSPAPTTAPRPQTVESSPDLAIRLERVYGEVEHILCRAEFERMPQEDLDKAKNDKSLMGLEVIPASEEVLEYRLYYRGTRTKKIEWYRWGLIKSQIEMNVYERLAITFKLKKPVNPDDAPSDPNSYGIDTGPWYRKLFCDRSVSATAPLAALRDEHLHLKLFKDVLQCDADMLLPGAVIKFTWLDYAMIWIPILFGCGCAIWKAKQGTIDFSDLMNGLLSVVLIVMPVTWGVRAYFAIKDKQSKHQAHLNALCLTHNLTNNGGVIASLLNEAQEQEDNEAMLAYFFLWQGAETPKPLRKMDLDRAVERYLQNKLDEQGVAVRMDYEVVDAVDTLQRMGLVRAVMEPAGAAAAAPGEAAGSGSEKRYQALPLDAALEAAHVRHFDEARETGVVQPPRSKTKRYGAISLAWHECQDVLEPTGQAFRYWWNAETGESSYFEPDAPYIKLGTAAAVDATSAHGQAMQQPTGTKHAKTT